MLELLVISHHRRALGRNRTRLFGTDGGSIGRAPDNFWVLPDPQNFISAHHCLVEYRDDKYWITDTSRNGVYVNGAAEPLGHGSPLELHHGDRLRLADYELLVRIKKNRVRVPIRVGEQRTFGVEEDFASTNPSLDVSPESEVEEPASDAPDLLESTAETQVSPPHRPERHLRIVSRVDEGQSRDRHKLRELPSVSVDAATMERNLILPALKDPAAIRAYKLLRTRVLRRMAANGWHSIAVTGTTEGEGKTVTAINLAVAMAWQSRTPVILVDLDLQRPRVAEYVGMPVEKGLAHYLNGAAEIDEVIYAPDLTSLSSNINNLSIIPGDGPSRQSSEKLVSPRMLDLVRYLEEVQPRPFIVYDMPPVLLCDDVLAFAPNFDTSLLVVGVGVTSRTSLTRAEELLAEVNMLGIVLNRSPEADTRGYYY